MTDIMDLKFIGIYTRDRVCGRCRYFNPMQQPTTHMLIGLEAVCLWADKNKQTFPWWGRFTADTIELRIPPWYSGCPAFALSESVADGDRIIDSSPELTQLMVTIRESERREREEASASAAVEESGGPS